MIAAQARPPASPEEGLPAPVGQEDPWAVSHSAEPTWQEYEARGDAAYAEAWERELAQGGRIDMETAELYREASTNLINMVYDLPDGSPEDPIRLLKLSHSFAAQADAPEVAPYSTPQRDVEGKLVDRRENFQRLSTMYLERAGIAAGNHDNPRVEELAEEVPDVDPVEVVMEAVVEAAQETSKGRPVVPGLGEITLATAMRVEAQGPIELRHMLGKLASQPHEGPSFPRVASEKALERFGELAAAA